MFRLVVWSCLVLLTGLPAETGEFCCFCVRADTRASAQKRPSAKYAIAWLTGISRPNIGHALCIQSRNRKFSWVYLGAVCRTSPSLIRPRYMRLEPRGQKQKSQRSKVDAKKRRGGGNGAAEKGKNTETGSIPNRQTKVSGFRKRGENTPGPSPEGLSQNGSKEHPCALHTCLYQYSLSDKMRHAAIKARNPEKTSGLYLDIYLAKSTDLPNPLINLINLPSTDQSTIY